MFGPANQRKLYNILIRRSPEMSMATHCTLIHHLWQRPTHMRGQRLVLHIFQVCLCHFERVYANIIGLQCYRASGLYTFKNEIDLLNQQGVHRLDILDVVYSYMKDPDLRFILLSYITAEAKVSLGEPG